VRPRRTVLSNKVFTLSGGTEDNDLWSEVRIEDGEALILSTWELSDEERQQIAKGHNIELIVWGERPQPVAIRTTDVQLGHGRVTP
jgi:hypothetical protein